MRIENVLCLGAEMLRENTCVGAEAAADRLEDDGVGWNSVVILLVQNTVEI